MLGILPSNGMNIIEYLKSICSKATLSFAITKHPRMGVCKKESFSSQFWHQPLLSLDDVPMVNRIPMGGHMSNEKEECWERTVIYSGGNFPAWPALIPSLGNTLSSQLLPLLVLLAPFNSTHWGPIFQHMNSWGCIQRQYPNHNNTNNYLNLCELQSGK